MGLTDKLVEALRTAIQLNERVTSLAGKIERLDADVRDIDRRVVRLETMVEIAAQGRLPPGRRERNDL